MSLEKKNSVFLALLVIMALVLVVFVSLLVWGRRPHEPVVVAAQAMAKDTGQFLGDLDHNGFLMHFKRCQASGICSFDDNTDPVVPAYAWRVMGNAALYKMTKDPSYLGKMRSDFSKILTMSNGIVENFSLIQIYYGYTVSGDVEMLTYVYNAARKILLELKLGAKDEQLKGHGAMLLAILSRELSLMNKALGSDDLTKLKGALKNWHPSDEFLRAQKEDFLSHSRRVLNIASELNDDSDSISSVDSNFHAFSCWVLWARTGLFLSTGESSDYDKAREMFVSSQMWDSSTSNLNILMLQYILPCVNALRELSPSGPEYRIAARNLFERFILPTWDSKISPHCDGDNGFMTVVVSDTQRCINGQLKSVADNAWITYLLSDVQDEAYTITRQ